MRAGLIKLLSVFGVRSTRTANPNDSGPDGRER